MGAGGVHEAARVPVWFHMPNFPKLKGRYEIREVLGQGGMGMVYRAYDSVLRCDVAVKTIRDAPDRNSLEMFYKECEVLAAMNHPNIVKIIDIGEFEEEGQQKPYFVMPLIAGITLDRLIRDSSMRLTPERCIEILIQTCRGLHAAHEQGVVHRDLKPSNIFVRKDDTVEIIDFGIVHMSAVTSTVGQKGTLFYMAPESIQMKKPTAASDIFALGVVAYEMLARRRPFDRSTEADTVHAILNDIPPPVSDLNPAVPQAVSRVVHKALAKQPWHRFASAREFAETLLKAHRGEPIEIFDAARIQPRVQRARKAFEAGDHQFAQEILAELLAEGHMDTEIALLQKQIELAARRRRISQLLESARTRIEGEEYPLALQKIQEVLDIDPDNADALSLRLQVEAARSERQIDDWFRLTRQHIDNRAYHHAREALKNVLAIRPQDTRALSLMAEVDRQEQEHHRTLQEKKKLYESAVEAYHEGELSAALSRLEKVLELDRRAPDSTAAERAATYQNFYNQVRTEHDNIQHAYAEAKRLLADQNYARALALCQECLTRYPGQVLFAGLKVDIEEQQRQQLSGYIAEVDRAVEAEPDLQKRVNILREAMERFPEETRFQRSMRLMRDRLELVNSIVAKARHMEERGQFTEALGQWEILRTIHSRYPGLDLEVERVTRRREQQARGEARARFVEEFERHTEGGDHESALAAIRRGLAEFPAEPELLQLEKLAQQGIERAQQAHHLLAEAGTLFASGQFDAGIEKLSEARRLDERNFEVRSALLTRLVERGRALLESDWHAAAGYAARAVELDPGDQAARSLQVLIDDVRREETLKEVLGKAREQQAVGQLQEAIGEVERGLSLYPAEPRLVQLHSTLTRAFLETERRQNRARDLERMQEIVAAVERSSLPGELDILLQQGRTLAAPYRGDSEFARLIDGLERRHATVSRARPRAAAAAAAAPPVPQVPPAEAAAGIATRVMGSEEAPAAPPTVVIPPPAPAEAPKAPQPPAPKPPAPPRRPSSKTPLYAGIGVLAVALVGGLAFWALSGNGGGGGPLPAAPVVVSIRTDPPGASIRIGDRDCGKTNSRLQLVPGDYQVQLSLDGFEPETASLKIAAGAVAPELERTLRPSPVALQILTDLRAAKVILDDRPPEEVPASGFVSIADVPPGAHILKVEGARGSATLQFRTAPGSIPVFEGSTAAKDVQAVFIGSYRDQAVVRSNIADGKLRIDGAESGTLTGGTAQLQGVAAGSHEMTIGEGDNSWKRSFEAGARPLIAAYVGSNANVGILAVQVAGIDGARVLIDGKERGVTKGGVFRINLEPKDYQLVVQGEGYMPVPPRVVSIKRGSMQRETFELAKRPEVAPIPAPIPGPTTMTPAPKLSGILRLEVTPANAEVTVTRTGEPKGQPWHGPAMTLPEGSYTVSARAAGHIDKSEVVQVQAAVPASLKIALQQSLVTREMTPADWEKSWAKEGDWYVREEAGANLYKVTPPVGTFQFTLRPRESGRNFLANPRIQFVLNYVDERNHTLFEIDKDDYRRFVVRNGARREVVKRPLRSRDRNYAVTLVVEPNHFVLRVRTDDGAPAKVDEASDADYGTGRFGFMLPGKERLYLANFSFVSVKR